MMVSEKNMDTRNIDLNKPESLFNRSTPLMVRDSAFMRVFINYIYAKKHRYNIETEACESKHEYQSLE